MGVKELIEQRRVSAEQCGELTDKTVFVNRVAKVVKGGRRFSFSALIVTGDGRGHIGFGLGKAAEVPDAIRKGSEQARKNLVRVPIRGTTIPHDIVGKFGSVSVMLKPAAPGTGVIAGSVLRSIVEMAGIKDIRTKCIGSSNPQNVVQAAFSGLLSLEEPENVAAVRGTNVEALGYAPF
jgi:small subunit ribosomal protein S5